MRSGNSETESIILDLILLDETLECIKESPLWLTGNFFEKDR